MATWDVFHSDRLEVGRGLSTAEVRAALASGDLRDDDLIRPAGTTIPWARLADIPPLVDEPAPEPAATLADEPMPSIRDDKDPGEDEDLDEGEDFEEAAPGLEIVGEAQSEPVEERLSAIIDDGEDEDEYDTNLPDREGFSPGSLEVVIWDDGLDAEAGEDFDPQEEDEAAAEFTLSRGSAETVEELDLAAMVDVAFQLVLFFLVTATTILYKSLEVPKPNPENNPAAAAQGKSNKTLDDLKET